MASNPGSGTIQFSAWEGLLFVQSAPQHGVVAVAEAPAELPFTPNLADEPSWPVGALLRVSEAAESLGVHENTIRNWIDKGFLTAIRLPSGHRRMDAAEVANLRLGIMGNLAPAVAGPRVELGDDIELDFQYGDPKA